VSQMTHVTFLDSFLPPLAHCGSVEEKVCVHFDLDAASIQIQMLKWSGFFDDIPVGLSAGSPARILEFILNKKWALSPADKDQIVMWHRFRYESGGVAKEIQASLVVMGSDDVNTAMAKTVGLPLGIATRLIAEGKIKARGVVIPTTPEFYNPILEALAGFEITLNEREIS